MSLHGPVGEPEQCCHPDVRVSFGDEPEDLLFALAEPGDGWSGLGVHECLYDSRVEGDSAVGYSVQGEVEVVKVQNALLEEVAEARAAEQWAAVAQLDVLREQEHPGLRVEGPQLNGGTAPSSSPPGGIRTSTIARSG